MLLIKALVNLIYSAAGTDALANGLFPVCI